MSRKFVVFESRKIDFTANAKVNTDIIAILEDHGFAARRLLRFVLPFRGTQRILSVFWWIYSMITLASIPKDSDVVVQYPNGCAIWERFGLSFFSKLAKKARLVLLVQDLDVPRFAGEEECPSGNEPVLRLARIAHKIIVHNPVMRDWFLHRSVGDSKMIDLQTFDYLATPKLLQARFSRVVIVAGNLAPHKAAYAAHLREIKDVQWKLFSPYFDEKVMGGENVTYAGVCKAEEFPSLLNSGFGLVWDGDSIDSCVGNAGRYTLMVSPHKFALYLASGLPVIVSQDAAIAAFVRENDVGITVKSLRELPLLLAKMTEERYDVLSRNALGIAHKVRAGYFTWRAVSQAIGEC